ncbi:MAG: ribosomal protein S18-alanine N-acetyltransferase [Longimicrobiales bacterium]
MSSALRSTPEEVTIRRMTSADLTAVMDIEFASYTMPWGEATFRGLLRRTDAELLVAETEGGLVGYAACWFVVDQGELGNVAVAVTWRRRGVGARLVAAVLARAAERGVRELFLEVRPSNAGAQRLYQRFGFEVVGRRRNYYIEPAEDAIVMRRLIPHRTRNEG